MNAVSPQGFRKAIFWLILTLMPLLFFALLEVLVRLIGLGHDYPLFIPVDAQPGYLQPNPEVVKRYFSKPEFAPHVSPDTLYFLAKKPAGSLRIVLLGESSAAGFPFGRFGSPSGMLEQRLKPLYPERQIEIINVAMAAINTYTLRDFTDEILQIKPDVVLIYTGHNEYLGVMGVGSALAARDSRWQTLTYIALRHSHVFQVFDSAIAGLRLGDHPNKEVNERTLMATVAADKNIAKDSPEYQQGIRQFEANMGDMVSAYRKAGVTVVLGTLASNERDQKPFVSQDRSDPKLQAILNSANELLAAGNGAGAEQQLKGALTIYPTSADLHYALGKAGELLDNFTAAQEQFVLAKDFDLLRFRAPAVFNTIINQFASQPGVYVADVQKMLRTKSPHDIIGSAMMLEHLHPTSDGYFWLSEAYLQTLQDKKILPETTFKLAPEHAIYWKPVSEIDEVFATWTIAKLTSDYPFTTAPVKFELGELNSPAKEFAAARYLGKSSWIDSTQKAFEHYQKEKQWRAALILVGQLSDALPMNANAAQVAAQLSMDMELSQLVLFYAERGLRIQPDNQVLLMLKAHALFIAKRFPDSKHVLQQVIKLNPEHPQAKEFLQEPWATSVE